MAKTKNRKYSFETVSRCPRCKSTNTVAVSTQGKVQYRTCRVAICRHRYTVIGKLIKQEKQKGVTDEQRENQQTQTQSSAVTGEPAGAVSSAGG